MPKWINDTIALVLMYYLWFHLLVIVAKGISRKWKHPFKVKEFVDFLGGIIGDMSDWRDIGN